MIGGLGVIASQISTSKTATPTITGTAYSETFKGVTTFYLKWTIKNNDLLSATVYTKIDSNNWVATTVASGASTTKTKSSSYSIIGTLYAYAQADGKLVSDTASLLLSN